MYCINKPGWVNISVQWHKVISKPLPSFPTSCSKSSISSHETDGGRQQCGGGGGGRHVEQPWVPSLGLFSTLHLSYQENKRQEYENMTCVDHCDELCCVLETGGYII